MFFKLLKFRLSIINLFCLASLHLATFTAPFFIIGKIKFCQQYKTHQ